MQEVRRHSVWLLVVILISYFVVGFPDGAFTVSWLGIAEDIQGMTTAHTGWILVGYSATYTLAGVLLSVINRYMKLQTIYFWGLIIMGLGFVGLALAPSFALVLSAISVYGLGTGAMASSMNSYMAKHFTARHNNWMHFFWGAGAATSPIIMGQVMATQGWRVGYVVITAVLGLVAIVLLISMGKKLWISDEISAAQPEKTPTSGKYLTKKWHEHVQVLTFFFLGGTDYTLVFFMGAALMARGYDNVAIFPAVYYLFMTLGRMVAGSVGGRLQEVSIVRASVLLAAVGIGTLYFTSNIVGMAITGFGLGPLLPTLVSDTSNAFRPAILPRIVGYELAAFGAGIAVLFFITSQILHFVSYEALFPLGLSFVVLVLVCNEVLEHAYQKRILA